jgi:hypothetical protein
VPVLKQALGRSLPQPLPRLLHLVLGGARLWVVVGREGWRGEGNTRTYGWSLILDLVMWLQNNACGWVQYLTPKRQLR